MYSIFTTQQVAPKYILVLVVGVRQQALNPGTAPVYPADSHVIYSPPTLDIYSEDPMHRRVLLSDPAGKATGIEILAAFPGICSDKYARLWQAAHDYEYAQISGSALALLTIGVLHRKEKSLAIQGWIKRLWEEYYSRKTAIAFDSEPDTDFTFLGSIPATVPELMAELAI